MKLDIPEYLPTNEPEVCALMGNLLENAVDGCRGMFAFRDGVFYASVMLYG